MIKLLNYNVMKILSCSQLEDPDGEMVLTKSSEFN